MKTDQAALNLHFSLPHSQEEAALWLSYLTAYGPLIEYGNIQQGQDVLITATSSPVGLAAIEIVKDRGGVVIATTRTTAKSHTLIEHSDSMRLLQHTDTWNQVSVSMEKMNHG